ncbi:LytTR family DNA-binding domain-containing protein [Sphingobacterium sp. SRCM116780]|uniref:LytR/AlgR family response regulator transcription factor n=1 Tax=Sphingobacterium sp. SRCM116780 TaxID=2907623 RepID=UPI001F16D8EF|nr:LytTR family DNA-binding domain-containing protein [Sphingobacterium sp. SRCM116780]UIR57545.1 LytTR family DNA-binding domain-containing protein [Sphingobacterium sp. SRCM116780]
MITNIRCICIDDEQDDLMLLNEYIKAEPALTCIGSFSAPSDGLQTIISLRPDLVFLDIEMPGVTGLKILKLLRSEIELAVFVTSHPEFALESFELSAFDYILKPVTEKRFTSTVQRLKDYWNMKQKAATYELLQGTETLLISEGRNKIKVPVNEIIYLEAMQNYTKVVTRQRSYLTLVGFNTFLNKLPQNSFLRIHRSYAIARDKINGWISSDEIICGNITLPIGKTYKDIIKNEIIR